MKARVEGDEVLLGNQHLMTEAGVDFSALRIMADSLAERARTVVYLAAARRPLGVLAIADRV